MILGLIILATAAVFVPLHIEHPFWMVGFLILTAVTFSLFGFIIGIWADGFEKLQLVPLLVVTPLTFLGGSFYSIDMLPPVWQTITLFNPVVYLISGFRWSFYGISDVSVGISLAMTLAVPRRLPHRRLVDLPHRLPAEIVIRCHALGNTKPKCYFGVVRRETGGIHEANGWRGFRSCHRGGCDGSIRCDRAAQGSHEGEWRRDPARDANGSRRGSLRFGESP